MEFQDETKRRDIQPIFLSLGDDLLIYFLSNWLDVKSLVGLDLALTNHVERLLWKKYLSGINARVFDDWLYCHHSIRWLISRTVRVSNVLINCKGKPHINDTTFEGINTRFLQSINLGDCENLTDDGILAICDGCNHLLSIDLTCCGEITQSGISRLAQKCPLLKSIVLNSCDGITDNCLSIVANGCQELQAIDLSCCKSVSDAGILSLVKGCPQLKSIILIGCKSLTDTSFTAIANGCPNLDHINLYDNSID